MAQGKVAAKQRVRASPHDAPPPLEAGERRSSGCHAYGCSAGRDSGAPSDPRMDPGPLVSTSTRVNGVRIHALVSTATAPRGAPAVVLVHGSGLSSRYMVPTAARLTSDFHVYVPDLPGFGNSFGCQVIADLAARHPDRVERAILHGPTTQPGERSWFWQFVRWRQNQKYNPDSLGEVTNPEYEKCGMRRMLHLFREQLRDRIEDKAPRIAAPVLVVRGEHDPIASRAWCEMVARLCPRGSLSIIPGVAHTLCYTAPVELAAVTRSFLTASPPPA